MRIIYAIILALILAFPALAQRTPKTITADVSTSALLWPTNLWDVERDNIYSSLGLWAGATNQTAAAWRAALGLSETTTNITAAGWRSSIGASESITNTTPAGFRLAYEVSDIATNTLPANWRAAIGVSEIATNTTAAGWRSALAVPANSGGFLTNATISGISTFSGTILSGSTFTSGTNTGLVYLDAVGDPIIGIVNGRGAFNENWPVIVDATDNYSPRYSVAVSNVAPSAGAILNRGTADYRYGIPTTFSKTGLVQAASAAATRSALGLGEWTTNSSSPTGSVAFPITIAQGGTGGTNAAQARAALDLPVVDVVAFGAIPNDGVSDYEPFETACLYAQQTGAMVWIPAGTYNFDEGETVEVVKDLRVEGPGDAAILKHAGESAATSTCLFRLEGATNVVMAGFQIQNARYGIQLRHPTPAGAKWKFDNLSFRGCRYGIYYAPVEAWTLTEATSESLVVSRCSFTPVLAGIYMENPHWKRATVEQCDFTGGTFGIWWANANMPTNEIPQLHANKLTVRQSTFTGQDHATAAHNGIYVANAASATTIEECVFADGSVGGSTSTDQAAIKMAAQGAEIRHCLFRRWGNATDKPNTIRLSGCGLEYSQTAPTGSYNYDPGWGALVTGCRFEDSYGTGTPVGCGRIYIETDNFAIVGNTWEGCGFGANETVYWTVTTPYTTAPRRATVERNSVIRCQSDASFLRAATRVMGVEYRNNLFMNCDATTTAYGLNVTQSGQEITVADNKVVDCPNWGLVRFSTSNTNAYHTNVRVEGNTLTNVLQMFYCSSGTSGNAGSITNLVIRDNKCWAVNTPVYVLSYVAIADSSIRNNYVRGATYSIPRLGTSPTFPNTEIFGNGLAATDRYSPFLGTGASAPTYPVAGGIWLSNSAGIYIYNGSTWVH